MPNAFRYLQLRHGIEGSLHYETETDSLYCGLYIRLRLLPTPPHDDAVALRYEVYSIPRHGLSPCCLKCATSARSPIKALGEDASGVFGSTVDEAIGDKEFEK